jgi:hypothetical protein
MARRIMRGYLSPTLLFVLVGGLVGGCQAAPSAGSGAPAPTPAATAEALLAPELPSGVEVVSGDAAAALIERMGGATCKADSGPGGQAPLSAEAAPPGPDEPRLWVAELGTGLSTVVDVGAVPRDAARDHVFTLQNVGTAPVTIEALSASCGCTRVEAETKTLAPGEATPLHVTYDPTVAEDKGPTFTKQVRIKSNDARRPMMEFTMTGRFEEPSGG